MDDDNGFDLVMPFVSVQSKGGPHDDSAFAAGYAMGLLDAELGGSVFDQGRAIRVEDRAQADLIAMRHGSSPSSVTRASACARTTQTTRMSGCL